MDKSNNVLIILLFVLLSSSVIYNVKLEIDNDQLTSDLSRLEDLYNIVDGEEDTPIIQDTNITKIDDNMTPVSIINLDDVVIETIYNYLSKYRHLSENSRRLYAEYLVHYGSQYGIDPYILAGVVDTESSFKIWIKHTSVTLSIPLDANFTKVKSSTVNAIGLSGVIYEIWKFKLRDEGIDVKEDLYIPRYSIKAGAIVLSELSKQEKLKGFTEIGSAIIKYYGLIYKNGNIDQTYFNKVIKVRDKLNYLEGKLKKEINKG